MLIVTGALTVAPENREALLAAARAHVARSRTEPGCLSHELFVDADDFGRLFFFERWHDRAALEAHFAQPGSHAFMRAVRDLALSITGPDVFEAG